MNTTVSETVFDDLQKELNGVITRLPADLQNAGIDFGKVSFSTPLAVLRPVNAQDIIATLQFAAAQGLKIMTKGTAHTTGGQSQCNGGIVIDITSMNAILGINTSPDGRWIDVEAGANWEKVIKSAGENNYALPVTTDWQKMSVGGTIATGGVGYTSHRHGLITDNILEMDVIDGSGHLFTCSTRNNSELFDAVRAGLGQYGIIVRVRLRLLPMPERMSVYQFFITDAAHFDAVIRKAVSDKYFECIHSFVVPNTEKAIAARVTARAGNVSGYIDKLIATGNKWLYFVELVRYDEEDCARTIAVLNDLTPFENQYFHFTDTYYNYITAEPPLIILEKSQGKNPHPQIVVVQPAESFCTFMNEALGSMNEEDMGEGPILVMPLVAGNTLSPMFKHPHSDTFYFIGFLKNAFPGTKDQVDEFCRKNILLYKRSVSLGGNRHPTDSLTLHAGRLEWQQHYGSDMWTRVINAKEKYDPANIFMSNLNIF